MTPSSNKSNNGRLRKDKRPDTPRPMRETENDGRIVQLVYAYRLLSQKQLERLLGKSRSTVQQTLIRLYHHHYLEREFLPIAKFGSSPTLYRIGKQGMNLLMQHGIEDFARVPSKHPSGMFLAHTLAINEVRIALTQACEQVGWSIPVWLTDHELKMDYDRVRIKGKPEPISIIPDSYFCIAIPDKGVSHFFLELDRGTMTTARFREKVAAYVAYYRNGGYAHRYGAQGFRVLTVTDTPTSDRSHNLAVASAQEQGIGRRFWFAHLPHLTPQTVLTDPIWSVAGEMDTQPLFTR